MHYLTEDSLQVYLNDSANIVHNSMSLYPINHDALIEAMDSPVKKKLMKVGINFNYCRENIKSMKVD